MRLEQRNGRARRIGRDGRPLEVIDFAPRDGELPALDTINRKRRLTDEFWTTGDPVVATDRSLERLPSRIVTGHPQIDLWARLDGSTGSDWLLRRYRAGIELRMRDADPEI
jgi:hypothetical protein